MRPLAKVLDTLPLIVIALMFVGVGTMGVFAGGLWASCALGGAVLLVLTISISEHRVVCPRWEASLFALLFLSLVWISCLYAYDTAVASYSALKLTTIIIPLIFLSSTQIVAKAETVVPFIPPFVAMVIIALTALCLLLYAGTHHFDSYAVVNTKLNRGFSYIVLLFFPLFAFTMVWCRQTSRYYVLPVLFVAVIVVALCLTYSRATQMGAIVAAFVFVAAVFLPRFVSWAMAAACLGALGWPFYARILFRQAHERVASLPPSWFHRVEIWDYLSYRIEEKPLLGWGVGVVHKLDWTIPHGALYAYVVQGAAHGHNAVVQLWVELGVGGLVVFACMSLWAVYRASRLPSTLRPYALACCSLALCLLLSAYNFWTDSLWAAMAMTAFAFAVIDKSKLSQC
ncbi:MAG: O-antigen ligase family protein [Alphaproteobacteria bacterium]|nr:O-antigen ligase family protein [Alphaproteobacteria bacterium]